LDASPPPEATPTQTARANTVNAPPNAAKKRRTSKCGPLTLSNTLTLPACGPSRGGVKLTPTNAEFGTITDNRLETAREKPLESLEPLRDGGVSIQ